MYYHITEVKNKKSILKNGLKCNEDEEIYLFENKSICWNGVVNTIANCIAKNQIFLDDFIMFEINPIAFETILIPDEVGEFSAKYQWILKQKSIKPIYINFCGKYRTDYKNFYNV